MNMQTGGLPKHVPGQKPSSNFLSRKMQAHLRDSYVLRCAASSWLSRA